MTRNISDDLNKFKYYYKLKHNSTFCIINTLVKNNKQASILTDKYFSELFFRNLWQHPQCNKEKFSIIYKQKSTLKSILMNELQNKHTASEINSAIDACCRCLSKEGSILFTTIGGKNATHIGHFVRIIMEFVSKSKRK